MDSCASYSAGCSDWNQHLSHSNFQKTAQRYYMGLVKSAFLARVKTNVMASGLRYCIIMEMMAHNRVRLALLHYK